MYLEEKKTGEALMRDVLEWAKKRDPGESYDWTNQNTCACARYAREKDRFKEWCARKDATWGTLNELACPMMVCSPHLMFGTMRYLVSRLEKAFGEK